MKKKDEPIKTYEEYKMRLKKVETARVLIILIPLIIIFILCAILFTNGKNFIACGHKKLLRSNQIFLRCVLRYNGYSYNSYYCSCNLFVNKINNSLF